MTVQTGAVGLDITAANYVHLVEPHWNPSVEDQAIARAFRMGQTRDVTIIRYVVKSSVEEVSPLKDQLVRVAQASPFLRQQDSCIDSSDRFWQCAQRLELQPQHPRTLQLRLKSEPKFV
ncbi:hypothetical protein N658DRAFT_469140 [Parathielavia hyrcaniae]|uniref:Helicase C-terminal domain-containing protein n=1 Tax=Parathielavia hyrcaniae TaxID=113614 RepID=A0AAN6Q2W1_9PEZI|nr:hypothetical protein N658DRAFT_469140 [Parathielavia hyrcaniae]